jgi:nucleotide-binding universal stress UspA family protein
VSDPVLVGVALDERDAAPVAFGRELARLTTGRLALLHAYPYEPLTLRVPEYDEELRAHAQRGVEQVAASLAGDDNLDVTVLTAARVSVARALQDAAEQLHAVAIVVGSPRGGTLGRVFTVRIGERLLHGAPCPVAVTPDGAPASEGIRRIAVAFDGSAEADEALQAGIALARAAGAKLTTYTVFEPVETAPALTVPGWLAPQSYSDDHRSRAEATVRAAAQRVPEDLLAGAELLTGDAALLLAEASTGFDLLVCGSRGYGPVRAVLLGSLSTKLARRAACPLLITPRGHGGELAARARAA